jgi:CLIP-associating protein 1/2
MSNTNDFPETKQFALVLLKEMIDYDAELFAEHLKEFIGVLVEHYTDDVNICELADDVLLALANSQDRVIMLLILSPLIQKEEPPSLQALIRVIKNLISRCAKYELDPILRNVTEPLVTTFNHPHANVRKSVVFCLVELYFVIGDSFES